MFRSDGQKLSMRELLLPLAFVFLGVAVLIPGIPGQGNTGFTVFGMSLAFVGAAIARARLARKSNGGK